MTEIRYIDRSTGKESAEKVPGGKSMDFIYAGYLGKLSLWLLIKRKYFSVRFGKYMSSSRSIKRIDPFVEEHQIDMSEYIVPTKGFQSFNDFFYRKVKPENRPISEGVVSPADGRVLVFQEIRESYRFFVKGEEFNVPRFLNDEHLAQKYANGAMCIVRLAPVDYHRFHFPVGGSTSTNKMINGHLYSVSPLALRKNMRIFLENKREYTVVSNDQYGKVLVCEVGATLTGGIAQTFEEGAFVEKGAEKGYFYFGGSTVILLFEKGKIKFSEDLITNTNNGLETLLKMGETIAI